MIDPTPVDIGRAVIYTPSRSGDPDRWENGVIVSYNATYVFVRYGADKHPKATARELLVWAQQSVGERRDGK